MKKFKFIFLKGFFIKIKECLLFLKKCLKNPKQHGALFPSSRRLAHKIAEKTLLAQKEGYILELGAGTGRVTSALMDQGAKGEEIIALEIDTELAAFFKKNIKGPAIIQASALNLEESLKDFDFKKKPIDVIICSLPMLNFSPLVQEKIISNCFILAPDAFLIQFTYKARPFLERFHLKPKKLGWVFWNIPPAFIWQYEKETLE